MINITIIGKMGTGKSTFIRKYIEGRKALIFDINNEYKLPIDNKKPVSRVIELDHKKFISLCRSKRNTVLVFEDSTGFIQGSLDRDFRQLLVEKRHTGNVSLLVFHSISSVPPRLLQLSDYVVLFKTSDEFYQVERKYPSLFKHYNEVNSNHTTNPYFFKLIQL